MTDRMAVLCMIHHRVMNVTCLEVAHLSWGGVFLCGSSHNISGTVSFSLDLSESSILSCSVQFKVLYL